MKGHTTRHILGKRSSDYSAREDFHIARSPARIEPHLFHTP